MRLHELAVQSGGSTGNWRCTTGPSTAVWPGPTCMTIHDRPARERPLLLDMEVIVRRQDHACCASITCMIRHYVARRAKVIEDHPHNAADRALLPEDGRVGEH